MNQSNFPSTDPNDLPSGHLFAHYKDRLSLLTRLDAVENTSDSDWFDAQPNPRRGKNTRAAKSRKGAGLITDLKKRLRDLDKH